MKLPKGFNKWNDEQRREWVSEEIKQAKRTLDELSKLSRSLIYNNFNPLDYERPDLEAMIDEESKNTKIIHA
jgi:hypothetical protein